MENKQITCEVIEKLRTTGKQGVNWTELRIVRWNEKWVNLEKRNFFSDKVSGEEKMGKAKGFDLSDLLLIQEKMDHIINVLKSEGQKHD